MVYLIKETHFLFLWSDCKTSQVPSSIVYSAVVVEPMRIARANNNPESFSTAIKPLIVLSIYFFHLCQPITSVAIAMQIKR